MINSNKIKEIVLTSGADICGIAGIERFKDAPPGFSPKDIFENAKSVIVFAKRLPDSVFNTKSTIPYSFVDDIAMKEIFRLTLSISVILEDHDISALPVPSEPYDYWDEDSMTGKGLLSLKHAAHFAGLGSIGRNSLLCNPHYGNLLKLGALVTDCELESDPIVDYDFCSDNCNLCIENCPSGALGGETVIQKNCRPNSEGSTTKGAPITVCYNCRKICPNRAGWLTN